MPTMGQVLSVEPYWQRFSRLKQEKNLSWSQLVRTAKNAGLSTLRGLTIEPPTPGEAKRGLHRYPSAETLEDAARALGVEPEEFPEYRLAKARDLLDERVVGLHQAMTTLTQFETALQERAARRSGTSTERAIRNRRPSQKGQTAASTPREGGTREP